MSELLEHHKLYGGEYDTRELIKQTAYENIDIIPANGYLMRTNMQLLLCEDGDQVGRFLNVIQEIEDCYDYAICDCGLLLDMTVTNVILASDLVIAPVKVGGFEIAAVDNLQEQVEDLRKINSDINVKVLMTMRQGNKTSYELEKWLKENSGNDT